MKNINDIYDYSKILFITFRHQTYLRHIPNYILIDDNGIQSNISSDFDVVFVDSRLSLNDIFDNVGFLIKNKPIITKYMNDLLKWDFYNLKFPYTLPSTYRKNFKYLNDVFDFVKKNNLKENNYTFIVKPVGGARNLGIFVLPFDKIGYFLQKSFIYNLKNINHNNLISHFHKFGIYPLYNHNELSEEESEYIYDSYCKVKYTIQPYIESKKDMRVLCDMNGNIEILNSPEKYNDKLKEISFKVLNHMKKLNIFYPYFIIDFVLDKKTENIYILEIQQHFLINSIDYGYEKFENILL